MFHTTNLTYCQRGKIRLGAYASVWRFLFGRQSEFFSGLVCIISFYIRLFSFVYRLDFLCYRFSLDYSKYRHDE